MTTVWCELISLCWFPNSTEMSLNNCVKSGFVLCGARPSLPSFVVFFSFKKLPKKFLFQFEANEKRSILKLLAFLLIFRNRYEYSFEVQLKGNCVSSDRDLIDIWSLSETICGSQNCVARSKFIKFIDSSSLCSATEEGSFVWASLGVLIKFSFDWKCSLRNATRITF